jgi:hypothetical protein
MSLKPEEEFAKFKQEGLLMREQANSIFKEGDTELVTPSGERVSFKRLHELEKDYAFFSLGPVYVAGQVPYSFLEQYTAELGEAYFLTIETPKEFLDGLQTQEGTWGNILHAIQRDRLDDLTMFMTHQYLSRKEENFLAGIYYMDLVIQDPVFKYEPNYNPDMEMIKIRVFLPQTQTSRVVLIQKPGSSNLSTIIQATPADVARDLLTVKVINQGKV